MAAIKCAAIRVAIGVFTVAPMLTPITSAAADPPDSLSRMDAAVRVAAGVEQAVPKKGKAMPLEKDKRGRVVVYVEGDRVDVLRRAVTGAGGEVSDSSSQRVRAAVPPDRLEKLAASAGVTEIRRPVEPVEMIISEGVQPSEALAWHGDGKQGSGVKVGILDVGFGRLDEAQESGEIPANVTVYNGRCGAEHGSSHGTTMAEVVHDMAPQAQLYLACVTDTMDFDDAARWLKDQGVSVVNVSLGFPGGGRGDGQADISQQDLTPAGVVAWLRREGIVVVAAAGNEADKHLTGRTEDPDGNRWINLVGASENQGFSIQAGGTVTVALTWDAWPTTTDDVDLFVMDIPAKPDGLNDPHLGGRYSVRQQRTGGLSPVETVTFTNTSATAQTYWVYVESKGIRPTLRYDLTGYGAASGFAYVESAGSIAEPASSPYAIAVGAITPVNAANGGGVDDYSSRGPSIDGRIKPDVTGFTRVSTLTGGVAPGSTKNGTSIAAAHVTGAAALYKGVNPSLDPAELESLLLDSSSRPGRGTDMGYGVLNLGPPRVPQPPTGSAYTPLAASRRVLDTADGTGGKSGPLGPAEIFTLRIDNLPEDTTTVALNLTGVSASAPTSVDVFATTPTGATTLAMNPGGSRSVMTVATLDPRDKVVRIRNSAGQTHLTAHLLGYFSASSSASAYTAVQRPVRLAMPSPVLAGGPANARNVPVRGVSGIPGNATATMVIVTATQSTSPTRIQISAGDPGGVWTFGSNVGESIGYTYLVPIAGDGTIRVGNETGAINLAIDVVGWFAPGSGARYVPLRYTEPLVNTLTGNGLPPRAFYAKETRHVQVTTRPRIPYDATGAVLSMTVPRSDSRNDLALWPVEYGWSGVPSLHTDRVAPNPTTAWMGAANAVVTPFDPSGVVRLRTDDGIHAPRSHVDTTDVAVDIAGYFVGGPAVAPPPVPMLRGHWKFDEVGGGTTAFDSSGNDLHANLSGGAGWTVNGVDYRAGTFNGSTAYGATAGPVVRTDQSFTVSAWARLTDTTDWRNVVSQDGGTVSAFYLEYLKNDNKWGFSVAQSDTAGIQTPFVKSVSAPTLGAWTHLAGVYDAARREIRLYVNGELQGSVANVTAFDATGSLQIGRFKWPDRNYGAYFAGGIDDVRAYQAPLSDSQVRDLYAAIGPAPPTEPARTTAFMEIKTTGELVQWAWNGSGYRPNFQDTNWGATKLIARFPDGDFLEVKNGELVEWVRNGRGYTRLHRDWGWQDARLITAIDNDRFLEIKDNGSLVEWRWSNAGYRPIQRDTGWGNTRQIAGLCGGNFIEVKGTELVEWLRNPTGGFTRVHRDWGWGDARLIAGLTCTSFIEVKDSGALVEWNWGGAGYGPTNRDTGWGNARLLG